MDVSAHILKGCWSLKLKTTKDFQRVTSRTQSCSASFNECMNYLLIYTYLSTTMWKVQIKRKNYYKWRPKKGEKKDKMGISTLKTRFLVATLQQIRMFTCRTNFFDNPFRKPWKLKRVWNRWKWCEKFTSSQLNSAVFSWSHNGYARHCSYGFLSFQLG